MASKSSRKSANKKRIATKPTKSNASVRNKATAQTATSRSDVDQLAKRTLNLWREQMMHLAQSPKALQEMSKVAEPSVKLFTQALDMWLMLLDEAGRMPHKVMEGAFENAFQQAYAPFKAAANRSHDAGTSSAAPTKAGKEKAGKRRKGGKASPRAKAASVVPQSGGASVAELAQRVAHLKERRAGVSKPTAKSGSAARMVGTAHNVTELAAARHKRHRKA